MAAADGRADGLADVVAQARVGGPPGGLVAGLVGVAAVVGSALALMAPSERMQDWAALPAPLARLWSWRPGRRGGRGNGEV